MQLYLSRLKIDNFVIIFRDIPPDFYKTHGDDSQKNKKYVDKISDLLSG